jgi:hypothetical protein
MWSGLKTVGHDQARHNRDSDTMAKSQKKSTREIRKPKASKGKPSVGLAPQESSPVLAATRKQRDKM